MGLLAPGRGSVQPDAERPGVAANALQVLREQRIPATHVVRVDCDSILYRNGDRCMTAWLRWTGARLIVVAQSGWPAEPAGWVLHDLARN